MNEKIAPVGPEYGPGFETKTHRRCLDCPVMFPLRLGGLYCSDCRLKHRKSSMPAICCNPSCPAYDALEGEKLGQLCSACKLAQQATNAQFAGQHSFPDAPLDKNPGPMPRHNPPKATESLVEMCIVCQSKPCDGKSRYCSNECHAVANGTTPLSGTFTLTSYGLTSPPLPYNATPTQIQTATDELMQRVKEEPQEIVNGLQFSIVPKFELIPREAILRLVRRIELGEDTKGKNAWNGLTPNQDKLLSKEALVKRLGHAVDHVYKLIDRLQKGQPLFEENEDDAAALMWAGMYACSATALIQGESCQPYRKTTIPSPLASTDPTATKGG